MKRFYSIVWEALEVICVAFLPLFISYQFLARPFLVQGASMEPNFQDGNYLIVDVVSYRFEDPSRGDVVVFHYPGNRALFYIKRVIGLPGDTISLEEGGIFVNGEMLDEKYLSGSTVTDIFTKPEFVLNDGQYFVMGDNRPTSFDSRSWGPLDRSDIVGVVKFRVWPPFEVFTSKEN